MKRLGGLKEQKLTGCKMGTKTPAISIRRPLKETGKIRLISSTPSMATE
jgi:hypothetical protein